MGDDDDIKWIVMDGVSTASLATLLQSKNFHTAMYKFCKNHALASFLGEIAAALCNYAGKCIFNLDVHRMEAMSDLSTSSTISM